MEDFFSLPIFFITFREALETSIIVSVLLALIKRIVSPQDDPALHRKMVNQVWLGTGFGTLIVVILGIVVMAGVYGLEAEQLAGAEDIWEGVFALGASIIITIMGAVLLRVSKLQDKWRVKLAQALNPDSQGSKGPIRDRFKYLGEKYALFLLPFITILREGFEAVLFIAGVGLGISPWAIPLPAVAGLLTGAFVGLLIYKGSNVAPIQYFLIVSTCFLYLVGAGLFSKGVWHLEAYKWNMIVGGDAAELGSGPGSYDIRRSVWHVNCCNPDFEGGGFWGIFNALLGWQNSATVGSVISYNLYWVVVTAGFLVMIAKEKGYWPLRKAEEEPKNGDLQPLLAGPVR
ncbi:Plasma membrane iron permease 2 [Pleurostoma richardsiae]|uniref:Plasma membrane iron permease 2 n=1 Tax=Pleurostoma richardsiae TaxID=41990 RepID=A0AA38VL59_9PEZI|nr:Plasma membrane iron permease 2 [Pleurostoma richardsiae]